jgi:hypothetical protein
VSLATGLAQVANAAYVAVQASYATLLAKFPVATADLADSAVTAIKLATNAVTTIKITDLNVTTAKIADANVTAAKIADGNVTTSKIADANIITSKIATGGQICKRQLSITLAADHLAGNVVAPGFTLNFYNVNFTVDDANSIMLVNVRGNGLIINTTTCIARAFFVVDNTGTQYSLGGTDHNFASGTFERMSFTGAAAITGLVAGGHTLYFYVQNNTQATYYLRASSQAPYEYMGIDVVEMKR